jgi:hypothetical protein
MVGGVYYWSTGGPTLSQPNSTSAQPQLNLGVTKYLVGPPPPPTTSRQPRKLIFGIQPYFEPTRKTTSKKEEEDLGKKFKNGRRPQKMKIEDNIIFF